MKILSKWTPKVNEVYSRSNSFKIKDGGYIINLDEYGLRYM